MSLNPEPQENIKDEAIEVLNIIFEQIKNFKGKLEEYLKQESLRETYNGDVIAYFTGTKKWGVININKSIINRNIDMFNNMITEYGRYYNPDNYSADLLPRLSGFGERVIDLNEINNLLSNVGAKLNDSNSLNYLVRLGDPNTFEPRENGENGAGFHKKYLKYKTKYLALKNKDY